MMRHKTKLIEKLNQEGIMPLTRSGGIQWMRSTLFFQWWQKSITTMW